MMDKFYEKKNFGIPIVILNVLAYLIGYSLTQSLNGTLLVAVFFALAVFSLQFDDKVKNAVKHSYIFATYFVLIYLLFDLLSSFTSFFTSGRIPSLSSFTDGFYGFGFLARALTFLYTYALIFVNIAVAVIFGLFILMTLLKKDMNLFCVKKVLEEAPPKPKNQPAPPKPAPAPQAPAPAPQPQAPSGQQEATPAPAPQPQAPSGQQEATPAPAPQPQAPVRQPGGCSNCGHVNSDAAKFCGSCGNKL